MISSDRGCLYEANDVDSLSNYMNKLWDNPIHCVELGKAGRKYVEETFKDENFYSDIKINYNRAFELLGINKEIK